MKKIFRFHLFEIDYPVKFVTIEHPQVLGHANVTWAKTRKIWRYSDQGWKSSVFCCQEVSNYIKNNLESIGKAGVKLIETDIEECNYF